MATKFTWTQRYDAPPDKVFSMLTDPDFVVAKGKAGGAFEVDPSVRDEADGSTVVVSRRTQPASGLPSFAQKIVGDKVHLVETQRFPAPGPDGTRSGSFEVDFGSTPMSFKGKLIVAPAGTGTTVTTDGEFKSSIPLVGGKLEGVAKGETEDYLRKEGVTGTAWLTEH